MIPVGLSPPGPASARAACLGGKVGDDNEAVTITAVYGSSVHTSRAAQLTVRAGLARRQGRRSSLGPSDHGCHDLAPMPELSIGEEAIDHAFMGLLAERGEPLGLSQEFGELAGEGGLVGGVGKQHS